MKSRYIRLAENGNLPRNNAPRLSTASPGMTSTARVACRASSDSCFHPGSLCAAGAPGGSWPGGGCGGCSRRSAAGAEPVAGHGTCSGDPRADCCTEAQLPSDFSPDVCFCMTIGQEKACSPPTRRSSPKVWTSPSTRQSPRKLRLPARPSRRRSPARSDGSRRLVAPVYASE